MNFKFKVQLWHSRFELLEFSGNLSTIHTRKRLKLEKDKLIFNPDYLSSIHQKIPSQIRMTLIQPSCLLLSTLFSFMIVMHVVRLESTLDFQVIDLPRKKTSPLFCQITMMERRDGVERERCPYQGCQVLVAEKMPNSVLKKEKLWISHYKLPLT